VSTPAGLTRVLDVRRLGLVPYAEAVDLQKALVEERRADRIPDTLLLLEHPHVITLGVKAGNTLANVRADEAQRTAMGVELCESGRGGDVTYHGPGQLVGYPILDLNPDRRDVHRYVRDLEEVLIRTVGDFAVEAARVAGLTGVWTQEEKIAAIGIRISRWITSHGFALNVATDLSYFGLIVPCGISDRGVTSLEARLGRHVSLDEVIAPLVSHFADVFARTAAGTWRLSAPTG
jgi:lipoyl(octanoyl) transferase